MRYIVRGIDKNGNVANFSETEQMLIFKNLVDDEINFISYLQIRGSIPIFWTQRPNMELNSKIVFDRENKENYSSFIKHANKITYDYGKTIFINLINKKGDQYKIGDYLACLEKQYKESECN